MLRMISRSEGVAERAGIIRDLRVSMSFMKDSPLTEYYYSPDRKQCLVLKNTGELVPFGPSCHNASIFSVLGNDELGTQVSSPKHRWNDLMSYGTHLSDTPWSCDSNKLAVFRLSKQRETLFSKPYIVDVPERERVELPVLGDGMGVYVHHAWSPDNVNYLFRDGHCCYMYSLVSEHTALVHRSDVSSRHCHFAKGGKILIRLEDDMIVRALNPESLDTLGYVSIANLIGKGSKVDYSVYDVEEEQLLLGINADYSATGNWGWICDKWLSIQLE